MPLSHLPVSHGIRWQLLPLASVLLVKVGVFCTRWVFSQAMTVATLDQSIGSVETVSCRIIVRDHFSSPSFEGFVLFLTACCSGGFYSFLTIADVLLAC